MAKTLTKTQLLAKISGKASITPEALAAIVPLGRSQRIAAEKIRHRETVSSSNDRQRR